MIREKRESKAPEIYAIPQICYPRTRKKKYPKKKPLKRAEYQTIPYTLKYVYDSSLYLLYGDIALKEHAGTLVTDTGLLNQFLTCKEVHIREEPNYKVIHLSLEKIFESRPPPWQVMVEKLKSSEYTDLVKWGNLIENYSQRYENMLRARSSEENTYKLFTREQMLNVQKESLAKKTRLYQKYPCLTFRGSIKDNFMQLDRVEMNEKYLSELGYSIDSFAMRILREGLPQLMPADDTEAVRTLIGTFYSVGRDNVQTNELSSDLILKNGYVRRIKFKVHYFTTYENDSIGLDYLVVVLGREPISYKEEVVDDKDKLNRNFLKKMIEKEKEGNAFLNKYYKPWVQQNSANVDRVCKIKEIDPVQQE